MKDLVFRKYDIRGKIGSEIDIDRMYDLGRALAYYFMEKNPDVQRVAIGMDGRTHSPIIKSHLCQALTDSGLDVVFVGVCTSPVLYYTLFTKSFDAGLMVTASHNPKEYNGIKICFNKKMIWGDEVQKIKDIFKAGKKIDSDEIGSYAEEAMIDPYIDFIKDKFPLLVGMELSAVADCANGAAGTVMPKLIEKMEWKKVKLLFEEVDGDYPNHEADPVEPENMRFVKDALAHTDAQVGVGFDGDCDRMAPMTKDGQLISGDKLLAIYSQPLLQKNPGTAIVFDVKASQGLVDLVNQWGGKPVMSPSGHSIVKKLMAEHGSLLGGELSCHFFFADRYFGYDDGVYAMMRLFEIMQETGKSLKELASMFPQKIISPEIRMQCSDEKKFEIVEDVKLLFAKRDDVTLITIDGIRVVMEYGWGILRVSNTQPVVSMRFESDTQSGLQKVKEDFYHVMKPHFDKTFLKEQIGI